MYSKSLPEQGAVRPAVMPNLPNKDIKITFTAEALADPNVKPCLDSGKSLRDCTIDQIAQHIGENYRAELESVIEQGGDNVIIYRTQNSKSQSVGEVVLSMTVGIPANIGTVELIEHGSDSDEPPGETRAASHFSKYKGLYIGAGVLTVAIIIMGKSRKS
jgi:hypothetical protein